MMSACSASRFFAVSLSVSPLVRLEVGGGDVDHVGAEAMGGELEAHARAGAGLDEEIDHRLAAQGRHFLDLARAHVLEGRGGVEHVGDFRGGQVLEADEVFAGPDGGSSGRAAVCFGSGEAALMGNQVWLIQTESGDAIGGFEAHVDPLAERGRQVLAHVIRADGQLAMAAIDEHRVLDARRAGRSWRWNPWPPGRCGRRRARRR